MAKRRNRFFGTNEQDLTQSEPTAERRIAIDRTQPPEREPQPITRTPQPAEPPPAPTAPGQDTGQPTLGEQAGFAPGSFIFKDPREGDRQIRAGERAPERFGFTPPTQTQQPSSFTGTFGEDAFLGSITGPPTAASVEAYWNQNRAALEAQGWSFISHPTDPKFVTPDGRFHVDVIQGGGGPNPRWQWLVEPANRGGVPLFGGGGGTFSRGGEVLPGGGFGAPSTLADIQNPDPLSIDLGPDPFGPLIESILGDLAANQGTTEFGGEVQDALRSIIESGGDLPGTDTTELEFERAREQLARAERIAQGSLRDRLASRNLLSVSGIDQGPEVSSIGRVQQRLGEDFASAVRDLLIRQGDQRSNRLTNALSLATGLAADQARSLLAVADSAGRQREVISRIAIDVLDRNIAWNMFLAQFGLDRAQVMAQIQQGNIALLLPLINQFFQGAHQAAAGFIGE